MGGRAVSEPYYSQHGQCLRLSEHFFHINMLQLFVPKKKHDVVAQTIEWVCVCGRCAIVEYVGEDSASAAVSATADDAVNLHNRSLLS